MERKERREERRRDKYHQAMPEKNNRRLKT